MSRRMFAHMVTRNEAGRYLQAALRALRPHVDAVHVHDDGSEDDSAALAAAEGAAVTRRPPLSPSFAESEGRFRQHAWDAFADELGPCPGDWVLCLDADEVLVAPDGLWPAVDAPLGHETPRHTAVQVPIPEVFGFDYGWPLVRVDGFWGGLAAPRLFAYQPRGTFRAQKLACGSVPTYVPEGAVWAHGFLGVQLLHMGYADPGDRAAKHVRYSGQPGHATAHVNSILTTPTLKHWEGPTVEVWRGRRP